MPSLFIRVKCLFLEVEAVSSADIHYLLILADTAKVTSLQNVDLDRGVMNLLICQPWCFSFLFKVRLRHHHHRIRQPLPLHPGGHVRVPCAWEAVNKELKVA